MKIISLPFIFINFFFKFLSSFPNISNFNQYDFLVNNVQENMNNEQEQEQEHTDNEQNQEQDQEQDQEQEQEQEQENTDNEQEQEQENTDNEQDQEQEQEQDQENTDNEQDQEQIDIKEVDINPKVFIKEYFRKVNGTWHKVLIEENIEEFIKMYKDIEHKEIVVDYIYSKKNYKIPIKSEDDLKYLQELDDEIIEKDINWCMIESQVIDDEIKKYIGPKGDFYNDLKINMKDLHLNNLHINDDTEIALVDSNGQYYLFDKENPILTFNNPRLVNTNKINDEIKRIKSNLSLFEKIKFLTIYYCEDTIIMDLFKLFYQIINIPRIVFILFWDNLIDITELYLKNLYPLYSLNNEDNIEIENLEDNIEENCENENDNEVEDNDEEDNVEENCENDNCEEEDNEEDIEGEDNIEENCENDNEVEDNDEEDNIEENCENDNCEEEDNEGEGIKGNNDEEVNMEEYNLFRRRVFNISDD